MKNWNRTGKIKALILGLLFLPNLIAPIPPMEGISAATMFMPLLFGAILIPFLSKVNAAIFGQVLEKPAWNDNPLHLNKPLRFFHFAAFFFLTTGLSMIIGTLIKYQAFNRFGLSAISFGLGTLIGIWILVRKKKHHEAS